MATHDDAAAMTRLLHPRRSMGALGPAGGALALPPGRRRAARPLSVVRQPLCEVLAKNEVSTCSTFLLLHFGQLGALAPCSDSGSIRSKTFSQSRQRYSYVGTRSSIPGNSQEAACGSPPLQALNQRRGMNGRCPLRTELAA